MNYRNCSVPVLYMLLILLCSTTSQAGSGCGRGQAKQRVRRLSSPQFDSERSLELAKYVVSIRSRSYRKLFGDNHFCGGAIIAPKFVLTAARCSMSNHMVLHLGRSLIVVAGTPNRLQSVPDETIEKGVSSVHVPKDYKALKSSDIALLQLTAAWPTNHPSINILRLPVAAPISGQNYTALGWGRIYKGGPLAMNILHIDVLLLDAKQCAELLPRLQPDMLCAGNLQTQLDASPCAGDTGSPLLNNDTLYGVVSYNLGCGDQKRPSIYTDVWYHLQWIEQTMKSAACSLDGALSSMLLAWLLLSVLGA